jgi:Uma2 family endonuclease
MGTVTTLPRGREFTRADLEAMPDDGRRHELIDGCLVVTPAPSQLHQIILGNLFLAFRANCPSELRVLFAPFDVALAIDTVMQPDLLVARKRDLTERDLPAAPVLAVEVLSASTRRIDLTLKRDRLEAAGCASYWVVDPDAPSITAWRLHEGRYVEVATTTGDEPLTTDQPYPVTITPARLLD